jgi:transposase-like protein
MATKRRFDREFKLQILQQAEHKPVAEVCREHNLHANMISRWRRELEHYPKDAFKGKGNTYKVEAQLAEAQRLIGQLYAENALLKKAIQSVQERQAEERLLRCIK